MEQFLEKLKNRIKKSALSLLQKQKNVPAEFDKIFRKNFRKLLSKST